MKHIVLREIRWFRVTYNSWRRNHQQYKSEIWTSQDWSCLVFVGSEVMFYINGAKECWQYSYAAMPLGSRFVSFTISRLISQAENMLSCAVNFLNVCPFLHLHRLPFKQILKTMGFVGWFLLFVSIWGLIVHLLWGEGGSHFEKAENIFKPSPPPPNSS